MGKTEHKSERSVFFLPQELQQKLNEEARSSLTALDKIGAMDEGSCEVRVEFALSKLQPLFFGFLMRLGFDEGAEVLTEYLKCLIEHSYYSNRSVPRRSLKKLSKPNLKNLILLTDFAVPQELWVRGINPFDGIVLIHEFLMEIGYSVELDRIKRAVEQLRREVKKVPCSMPQSGQELAQ